MDRPDYGVSAALILPRGIPCARTDMLLRMACKKGNGVKVFS